MRKWIESILAVIILAYFLAALIIPMLPFMPGARRMTESQRKQANQARKTQHDQRPQHRG